MRQVARAIVKQADPRTVLAYTCTVATVTPSLTVNINGGVIVGLRIPGVTYTVGETAIAYATPPAPPVIIPTSL